MKIEEWVEGNEREVLMAFEKSEIETLIKGLIKLKDEL